MTRDTTETTGSTDATAGAPESADATATTDESSGRTMGEIDHTHPHRNTTFGSIFGRGPTVAADGGTPATATQEDTSMAEVSHESPTGTDPSAVFDRGSRERDGRSEVPNDE